MTNLPNDQRQIWADAYKIFDHFFTMQNAIEDWDKLIDACDAMCDQYKQHPLAVELCCALYKAMEEEKDVFHHRSSGNN